MRRVLFFVLVTVFCLSCGTTHAGIAYTAPAGGWAYVYTGEGVAPEVTTALDGTWDHKDAKAGSSDAWDGSAIGPVIGVTNAPGGVSALTEGSTKYIRIQDAGRPDNGDKGSEGWDWSDPSNRKFTFVHDLALDGVDGATILDNGVTLNFRLRVPTSGPLDREYDKLGVTHDWTPAGYVVHSDGLAPIAIKQGTGGNGMIGFGLALKSDNASLTQDGLVMNNLVGNVVIGGNDVTTDEAGQAGKSLNLLTGFDVTQWHEFWVTIIDDVTNVGTHEVKIWMDGNMGAPDGTFIVTAGNKDEYDFNGYLDMSLAVSDIRGSQDIDFFAYAAGASNPVPEPATIALLGFGGLALLRRKRS